MKKLLLLPLLVFVLSFQNAEIKPIEIGTVLPKSDLKMLDVLSGKEMAIADLKGEFGTLVIFFLQYLPLCRSE